MLDYIPWWQYLLILLPLYAGLRWMESREEACVQLDPQTLEGAQKAGVFLQILYPGPAQALLEHLSDPDKVAIREASKGLQKGVRLAKPLLFSEFLEAAEPKKDHEWEEFEFERIINRKIQVNPADAAKVLRKMWLLPG